MEIYPSYFSLYLASLEAPQVPKRTKKKGKIENTSVWYPYESGNSQSAGVGFDSVMGYE